MVVLKSYNHQQIYIIWDVFRKGDREMTASTIVLSYKKSHSTNISSIRKATLQSLRAKT